MSQYVKGAHYRYVKGAHYRDGQTSWVMSCGGCWYMETCTNDPLGSFRCAI